MSATDDMRGAENSGLAKPAPLTFILSPRRKERGMGEGWLAFSRIDHAFRESAP
jgi:hypothetical protein